MMRSHPTRRSWTPRYGGPPTITLRTQQGSEGNTLLRSQYRMLARVLGACQPATSCGMRQGLAPE
eukprot:56219-Eustigmatos_ZCMA.PRE.1